MATALESVVSRCRSVATRHVGKIGSEPGFCNRPFAHDRRLRDADDLGDFFVGQAAKVPQFDDALLTRAERGHPPQRLLQCEDVNSRTLYGFVTGEGDAFASAATLVSQTRSRVVDQNSAHQGLSLIHISEPTRLLS